MDVDFVSRLKVHLRQLIQHFVVVVVAVHLMVHDDQKKI